MRNNQIRIDWKSYNHCRLSIFGGREDDNYFIGFFISTSNLLNYWEYIQIQFHSLLTSRIHALFLNNQVDRLNQSYQQIWKKFVDYSWINRKKIALLISIIPSVKKKDSNHFLVTELNRVDIENSIKHRVWHFSLFFRTHVSLPHTLMHERIAKIFIGMG